MKSQSLPLGIDVGTARIRVVHAVMDGTRRRVRAIAARDVSSGAVSAGDIMESEYVAALVEDAVRELKTPERRCVAAIGLPAATLRHITLPQMTAFERVRTARFEATRYIHYPIEEAIVRIRRLTGDSRQWALGIVRARTMYARVACLRRSGLRVRAVHDEGCALRRCLPEYDAVLDIGEYRSTIYAARSLETWQIQVGGAKITAAIERDLHLDGPPAEKRKRILGTAGAGEREKCELVASLASLVRNVRGGTACQRIAAVGNGARLPGLLSDLMSATNSITEFAVSHALDGESYSRDVIALGAPDWTLAASLAG
jgi:Tfp pilus assembly PilM family ATPase